MIKNLKTFIISGILYLILLFLEIYWVGFYLTRPIIDLLLLFLIELMFFSSFWWVLLLLLLKGIIFDSLSGIGWGVNLVSLLIMFIIGYYLLKLFAQDSFLAKILIGSLMIIIYFVIFSLLNIFWLKHSFNLLLVIDLLLNLLVFVLGNLTYEKLKK